MNDQREPNEQAAERTPSSVVAEENIRAVASIEERAVQARTFAQRMSDSISALAAREWTVALHVIWFALWIGINTGWLPVRPFDPYPFTMLSTVVSLEAIFLTLFVLASQNRLRQEADHRAHLDLQVNLLAEQEMTVVMRMLKEVCEHLGLQETINSKEFVALAQLTDVGELADHVRRGIGSPVNPPAAGDGDSHN